MCLATHTPFRPILPSAPGSLPPQPRFRDRPRLPFAPCSLPPSLRLASAPYSLPPHARFRPSLPSAPASLPPQPPVRPSLASAPACLPPVGVRGCLSAEVECDGAALASCSVSMCGCAARIRGGSQAHPLPSCAPVVARLAVHARSHSMAPNERSRTRTMANTPLARRLRDKFRSPLPPHDHQACVRTPKVARTVISLPQPSGSKDISERNASCA